MIGSSDFEIRGTPSVQGSILGVRGREEVLILKSGAPQSKAPSSKFAGERKFWFKNQGRPISPRLHPRSARVIGSSASKIRGTPSVQGYILGVPGREEVLI